MNFLKTLFNATFKNVETDSKSFQFNVTDFIKLFRNAGLVAGGAFIADLLANVNSVDVGDPTMNILFVTVAVAGLEFLQRLVKNNQKEDVKDGNE